VTGHGEFSVRFWGVRGSIACPGEAYVRFGGNTSCLEVRCGSHLILLDGGTGLRELGRKLDQEGPLDADIFFSHSHLDHIVGIPFFRPLFNPKNRFRLWAGHLVPNHELNGVLCAMMAEPLFPVPPAVFSASTEFHDFHAGETLTPRAGITVRTARLNHPNGATGYRIEFGGRVLCYVTDTEHVPGKPDKTILELISGADLFIYDCTYTDEEFPRFVNWGHSTWQEGVRLADAANARRLVLFHHDPAHDDHFMDKVAADADELRPGTLVAHEGMAIHL
jgi:phosphoribosyl 1,2-cyclic phosphodiesterase